MRWSGKWKSEKRNWAVARSGRKEKDNAETQSGQRSEEEDEEGAQPAVSFQAAESFSGMRAGASVKELISDVSKNRSASRRDVASGDQSEEAGEKLAEIDGGRELRELGEEVGREIFRIVIQLQGSGGFGKAEMVRTKAEMGLRASEAATLPVGVAIQATSGIVEGDAGRFRENGGARIVLG